MQRIILLFIGCLILTSCRGTTSQVDEGVKEENISLINEYEKEINRLKNENFELKERLAKASAKDIEVPTEEVSEVSPNPEELIIIDNYQFRISIKGTKNLEDGVILIMESLGKDEDVTWMKVWDKIDVTELAINSEPSIFNEEVYIVVDGSLYIINAEDGEVRMVVEDVGKSYSAPVMNKDGIVFTIGQYEPYVTAIDSNGSILWQITDEAFSHAWKHELVNGDLVVDVMSGTYTMNNDGSIFSFVAD